MRWRICARGSRRRRRPIRTSSPSRAAIRARSPRSTRRCSPRSRPRGSIICIHVVTQEWPQILGLDAVAVALCAGDTGVRADASGLQFVDPRLIERSVGEFDGVLLRGVERGHPLFGPACELIRAEALIRLTSEPPLPSGLLALGQRGAAELRHPPRLGAAHLPRPGADPLHGPVADPLTRPRPAAADRRALARPSDPRAPPLRAYRPRLCRDRAPADRLPRRPSRRARSTTRRWPRCSRRTCAPSDRAPRRRASAMRRRRASCRRCAASSPSPRRRRGGEAALPRLKGPKKPRSVPRPISPDEAVSLAEEAARGRGRAVDRGARRGGADCCSTARACASPRRSA